MSHYTYAAYEISRHGDDEEHLRQHEFLSPHEAVKACLVADSRLSYLVVEREDTRKQIGLIHPFEAWVSWDAFESLVAIHIKSTKIQLGEDESLDDATLSLICGHLERK